MTYNKIMKLKAEAEASRAVKELGRTGRATIYYSSKKIGDLELNGEEVMFEATQRTLNALTNGERIFLDVVIKEIKYWMNKQYASKGEEYKVYTRKEAGKENINQKNVAELQKIVNGLRKNGRFMIIIGSEPNRNAVILTLSNNEVEAMGSMCELTEFHKSELNRLLNEIRKELHK